jgi:hypothetical protein
MSQEARNALAGEKEMPLLVGKVLQVDKTLCEVKELLMQVGSSVNRLSLAPPRPMPGVEGKPSPEKPNSIEMRLDDVQMLANDVCREAAYLAERLEKLA